MIGIKADHCVHCGEVIPEGRLSCPNCEALKKDITNLIELREQGLTYQEIGEKVGLSKQRIYQLIGGNKKTKASIKPRQCMYHNIRKWMNSNNVSMNALTRIIYGNCNPANVYRIRNRLNGTVEPTKTFIDRVLEITNLTYEEAFKRSDTE